MPDIKQNVNPDIKQNINMIGTVNNMLNNGKSKNISF